MYLIPTNQNRDIHEENNWILSNGLPCAYVTYISEDGLPYVPVIFL